VTTKTWGAFGPRLQELEVGLCRRAVRIQERRVGLAFFRVVSRLGDGGFWFVLAALMALTGDGRVLSTVARMATVGLVSTIASKLLKRWACRPRPCTAAAGIAAGAAPLDPWSFPSGHTLHAVAFTAVVGADLPTLALLLLPFTLAVALSRVVLGLHYPSDVVAGAALGLALAGVVLAIS
jgi:undecaprenyl-diphosphatase